MAKPLDLGGVGLVRPCCHPDDWDGNGAGPFLAYRSAVGDTLADGGRRLMAHTASWSVGMDDSASPHAGDCGRTAWGGPQRSPLAGDAGPPAGPQAELVAVGAPPSVPYHGSVGRMLELSTKCAPSAGFQVAAETRAFLANRGIDLSGEQQTKTKLPT